MISPFGMTSEGPADKIDLEAGEISCSVITYGAALQSLTVPDREGFYTDVALGYQTASEYESRHGRMGAVIGRFANRIAYGRFPFEGRTVELSKNRGPDHIHGGFRGFDRRIWHIDESGEDHAVLSIRSADGEEGYPGNLEASVRYTVSEEGLRIDYLAHSDADTVCSLTNHSYFNLAGQGNGDVSGHTLRIGASRYLPSGDRSLPTGEIVAVDGTPMDFREPRSLGARLRKYGGYDCCYLLDGEDAAEVSCGDTGITMKLRTDLPALQFYTAEGLKPCTGKDGASYGKRSGLCLETEFCPDTPNHGNFPSCVLHAGEEYRHYASFSFR
ncbi:MAG: galactose mutarotase [Methanomethylophilus alvi]|nr:MAG: galactose mutarotase [Methanomethylophilus alvi]